MRSSVKREWKSLMKMMKHLGVSVGGCEVRNSYSAYETLEKFT
jgi:hypothetical protein